MPIIFETIWNKKSWIFLSLCYPRVPSKNDSPFGPAFWPDIANLYTNVNFTIWGNKSRFAFSLESYLFSPIKNWLRQKRNISGKFTLVSLFQIRDKLICYQKTFNQFLDSRTRICSVGTPSWGIEGTPRTPRYGKWSR